MGDRAVVWWEDMNLPFARGLMKKYNELHSHENLYGVSEEASRYVWRSVDNVWWTYGLDGQ
jgi:hypothetical protein